MERRDQMEAAADRLRGEWLLTLRELDRRRAESLSLAGLRMAVSSHPMVFAAVGLGVAAVVGGGAAYLVARKRRLHRLAGRIRRRALVRAWRHPERIATRAPDQPGGQLVARKVLMAALTTLGVQLATRLVKRSLP